MKATVLSSRVFLALTGASVIPSVAAAGLLGTAPPRPSSGTVQRALRNRVVPANYTLTVTVTTGDDDLSSDSKAWIKFYNHTGGIWQNYCVLKDGGDPGWSNNSEHVVTCSQPVGAAFIDEMKQGGYAELTYDGFPGPFHTYDNWTVMRVQATALDRAHGHSECVLDASGKPLARMTQETRTFTLIAHCPFAT